MPSGATLSLMVKAPEEGLAKTRLVPALGKHGAAKLAGALLRDALGVWQASEVSVSLVTTGNFDAELQAELAHWPQVPQGEGCLGARMERALRAGLSESEVSIVLGTDIPGVGVAELQETMRLLHSHDAVLGPAADGGFYWLALRQCPEGLLLDLPWSDSQTCEQTRQRLIAAGMRVAMLPERFDVDTPEDLPRLGRFLQDHPSSMPYAREFLTSSANQALSVIIPVLNEEEKIASLLEDLQRSSPWSQIIVVDGGSNDATLSIVSSFAGVCLLRSRPGRARQLNCGAAAAVGGTLLFLHADARLPPGGLAQIREVMSDGRHLAGAFRLRTRYDESGRRRQWLRPFLRLADLRSHYSKSPYGDQGLFVRAQEFHALGGYPDQPLFEDLHLSQALAKRQDLAILPGPMVVSGRRFQERPLYYLALMNSFPLLYRLGVSPRRLASFYPNQG